MQLLLAVACVVALALPPPAQTLTPLLVLRAADEPLRRHPGHRGRWAGGRSARGARAGRGQRGAGGRLQGGHAAPAAGCWWRCPRSCGWAGMFGTMAGLCLLAGRCWCRCASRRRCSTPPWAEQPGVPFRELMARLKAVARQPGAPWFLAAVATYKLGETRGGVDVRPVPGARAPRRPRKTWRCGWAPGAWWARMLGRAAGALLATRLPLVRAVGLAAAVRGLPILVQWALVVGLLPATAGTVIPITSRSTSSAACSPPPCSRG